MADDPNPARVSRRPSRTQAAAKAGAIWFYIIAGLSVLNSIFFLTHAGVQFIFGLGITQVIDGLGQAWARDYPWAAVALNVCVALVFAFIGFVASRGFPSAVLVGLVLYLLDALIFIFLPRQILWIPLLVHAYIAFRLIRAYLALRTLQNSPPPPAANPSP